MDFSIHHNFYQGTFMGELITIGLWLVILILSILVFFIPYKIAKTRGVPKPDFTYIVILNWSGLLIGVTWFVALVWAIMARTGNEGVAAAKAETAAALESLKTLKDLLDSGAITQEEFEKKKRDILQKI